MFIYVCLGELMWTILVQVPLKARMKGHSLESFSVVSMALAGIALLSHFLLKPFDYIPKASH